VVVSELSYVCDGVCCYEWMNGVLCFSSRCVWSWVILELGGMLSLLCNIVWVCL